LITDNDALFVENTTGAITATLVNTFVENLLDSMAALDDTAADLEMRSVDLTDETKGLMVDSIKVVGAQGANIAQLAGGASLADTITAVNSILTALKTHGLINLTPDVLLFDKCACIKEDTGDGMGRAFYSLSWRRNFSNRENKMLSAGRDKCDLRLYDNGIRAPGLSERHDTRWRNIFLTGLHGSLDGNRKHSGDSETNICL
jgi:hypothetical protein